MASPANSQREPEHEEPFNSCSVITQGNAVEAYCWAS